MNLILIESAAANLYDNPALENFLLKEKSDENSVILYYWKNDNIVVIARNQNPFMECNIKEL